MARHLCGHSYDGWECPVCSIKRLAEEQMRQAERQHKEHVQAIDRATEQQSRESERQHQELLEATGWPAAEQQAAALIEAAERRRRTTANALSLDARAKSERAVSLYDSGMYDEAYQLAVQSIEQDPDNLDRFWRKLVGRGDFATASKLAEHLSTRLDSLLAECYLCQGYSHFGRDGKGRIDAFVAKAAIGSRRALEADLAQIRQASDEGRLSQDIVAHAVRSLSEKYRQWKSAIETQLRDEAVASTKSVQVKTGAGVCGVLSFVVLALVSGTYCLSHGFRPDSTGPIAPFGSLFGAILIGVLYGRYVKRLRTGPIMWKNLTAAFSEENRRLGKLGLPTLTPPSQSDSLHLFEPLIYGGIIAVYIGVWFSLMAGQGRPSRTGSANNPPAFSSNRAALPGAHVALKDAGIFTDELTNTSSGNVYGISWTNGIGNHGAVFSAANSSRIEYAGEVPREGTFELWINVASGYRYDDYTFRGDLETAMVFSTDVQGGDVTWPGTTKFYVSRNGNVSLVVAENKYDNPPTNAIEAQGTPFRFGEWHAVGFSAGSLGEYIMVDGKVVAAAPTRTQQIGCAGTHQAPADLPTVGETASHYWPRHRYEGGFEGIVARFRASPKQQDWYLARGIFEKESRDRAHVAAANGADQQSAGRTEESYTRQDRQQNQSRGRPEGAGGPAIASFEAVPFAAGGPGVMILRWTITGATAASIEPGVGAVRPSSGYKIVRPVQTTTYTLQVKGEGESSVSRDVTFTVSSAGKPN